LLDLFAVDRSKDGSHLLFSEVPTNLHCAIGQIAIDRPSDVTALVKNDACNIGAKVSPDGRWIAYSSSVAGRSEVYVERYPELGDRQAISTGGGVIAEWSRDGQELFFNTPDFRQIFSVPVESGTRFGRPQLLFELAMLQIYGGQSWDVAPDGRFLIITNVQAETERQIVVVQNWFDELQRLVPAN
jgi:eukaryotic-like serine/threonine-protein kinase